MRISIRFPYAVFLFILPAFLMIFSGCAGTPYRANPDAGRHYSGIRTIVLAEPDLTVYELNTGKGVSLDRLKSIPEGVRKPKPEWSQMAVSNVQKAVAQAYEQRGVRVVGLHGKNVYDAELREVQLLFRAVNESIMLHAGNDEDRSPGRDREKRNIFLTETNDRPFADALEPFPFPSKQQRFVYGVGSVKNLLKRHGGQALVLITGFDEISNTERKTLLAAGILAESVLLPMGVPGIMETGKTNVSVAVVSPEGEVLCYSSRGDLETDLLNPASADKFVRQIMSDLPDFK